jgi:acetyltransferase
LGVARYAINPDGESCEFAVVVADVIRGKGLGQLLMISLMDFARSKGLKIMEGKVLNTNVAMLKLMERLAFTIEADPEDNNVKSVRKAL